MSTKGYHLFSSDGSRHLADLCDSCASNAIERGFFTEVDLEPLDQCESDSPTHCEDCDALLDHALTGDGYEFIAETLTAAGKSLNSIEWEWYIEWGDILVADGYLTGLQAERIENLTIRD